MANKVYSRKQFEQELSQEGRQFNRALWDISMRVARKSVVKKWGESHDLSRIAESLYRQHTGEYFEVIDGKKFQKQIKADKSVIESFLEDESVQKAYTSYRTEGFRNKYGEEIFDVNDSGDGYITVNDLFSMYNNNEITLNELEDMINRFKKEHGIIEEYRNKRKNDLKARGLFI